MYSLNMPVSAIRTKIRQEFEQHRYVNQLSVVDVLIQKSNAEFQVSQELFFSPSTEEGGCYGGCRRGASHIPLPPRYMGLLSHIPGFPLLIALGFTRNLSASAY